MAWRAVDCPVFRHPSGSGWWRGFRQAWPIARTFLLFAALVCLLLGNRGGLAAAPLADPGGGTSPTSAHVADQLLVKFHDGVSAAARQAAHARAGGRPEARIGSIDVQVVRVDAARLSAALRAYRADVAVRYAEPNYLVRTSVLPNDPDYSQQWALDKVQAPAAWDIQQGDAGVVIAVVDTGVDPNHPDLASKLVPGWNYDSGSAGFDSANTADDNGHGTHVAGIAGAATDNGTGIAGLGFRSSIMPVKVLSAAGSGTNDAVANGITYAADHGARVINLSLGGADYSQTVQDAVTYAYNRGALVVAAAGNSGDGTVHYPAANLNAVAVAATDQNDFRASFSSYGSHLALAAPGVGTRSTFWSASAGSTYAALSGTSMATPHVAGLAGLLFAQDPARSPDTVQRLLQRGADDVELAGWDQYTGHGRINARRALTGAIAGTVTDAANGAAVGGATVEVLQGGAVVGRAVTQADGRYVIAGLPAGAYDVRAAATGYLTATRAGVAVVNGQDTTGIDISLQRPPGAIAGKVTDSSAKKNPIGGATVEVVQGGVVVGSATTAADGSYTVPGLPAGTYDVRAAAAGYVAATQTGVTVLSGQTTAGVNFALAKARR